VNRREFLRQASLSPFLAKYVGASPAGLGENLALAVRLVDVTAAAGIQFQHNTGAYGGKLLPETLGAGCAFIDYDGDGWQDVLLVNGTDWPGHKRKASTLKLYRNNRNGTFSDVTVGALRSIKRCAITLVGFVAGAVVFILMFGDGEDRPAGLFMSFLVTFASSVIAIAAAMFSRNLQNALNRSEDSRG